MIYQIGLLFIGSVNVLGLVFAVLVLAFMPARSYKERCLQKRSRYNVIRRAICGKRVLMYQPEIARSELTVEY